MADQMALIEEAEAEAAEAEALAAAAAARARAARLRRQALVATEADETPETEETEETEDDDYESDDYESDDYEDAPLWRRWLPSLSTIAQAVAVLLICAFVAASGYMVWHHRDSTQRQQRVAKFVDAAKQGIIYMTTMDFNRAKQDVQRLLDSATGQFRDDFSEAAFTKAVEQSKVATEGTVTGAGVESMDDHSARVLVSATSHIVAGATGPKDEPRPYRFRVIVTDEGGQYKMSKVEFVP
jgi:Mce-associated membrane protein